jgi:hypothetical protein
VLSFALYLSLVHLHLLMDSFGSGIGWTITYLWPFSSREFYNNWCWDFFSWQNQLAGLAFIAWTIVIAAVQRRTPLEVPMPSLDRQIVDWLRRRFGLSPAFASPSPEARKQPEDSSSAKP